jgi:hypothetical protein
MNLLVLAGACLAFREGRLTPPRRMLWAGALFGLGAAVKYWALLPALGLLTACLLTGPEDGPGQEGGPGTEGEPGLGQGARKAAAGQGGLVRRRRGGRVHGSRLAVRRAVARPVRPLYPA